MDSTVEQLAEGVGELKEEVENTIVEFTDSLKEKLLSPQVREAIDTIEYLIGKIKSTERLLIPFPSRQCTQVRHGSSRVCQLVNLAVGPDEGGR